MYDMDLLIFSLNSMALLSTNHCLVKYEPVKLWASCRNSNNFLYKVIALKINSVTRFGNLLDFGQLFKAIGNN